jgi:hypothetical protein
VKTPIDKNKRVAGWNEGFDIVNRFSIWRRLTLMEFWQNSFFFVYRPD